MSLQEKSTKSARYYLSENDWNVEKAVNEYKQDLEWERNNVIHTKPFKSNPTPKKYREQELMYKKYIWFFISYRNIVTILEKKIIQNNKAPT